MPVERDGKYFPQLIINTGYDWNESLEEFNKRIYNNNYKQGILSCQNTEDLILHEVAHFLTFQECDTFEDYLEKEKNVARLFVPGVSEYNNDKHDGAETIAEGWIAMRHGIKVPEDVVDLVNNHVERWKRQ